MKNQNGWHSTTIKCISQRNHNHRTWKVTWPTQHHECCGQRWRTWRDDIPVLIEATDATLTSKVSQCGTCGSLYVTKAFWKEVQS